MESLACERCGAADGSHAPGCGALVDGRYAIVREIGRGAIGVIHLARDVGLGREVAIKVMSPRLARSASFLLGLQREASALARLRHENVVQVYAFGSHEGSPFFAMEYVRGRDLGRLIADHGAAGARVPTARALTIFAHVAAGLDAVHRAGLVHRDVKPSNIVVEHGTGRPVLVDFGLATPAARLESGAAVGTPAYMSPEQAMGRSDLGGATDQYALACAAYEALTGRVPFEAGTVDEVLRLHVRGEARPISAAAPRLAPLEGPMARALSKDPGERFPTCAAFARALLDAAASLPEATSTPRIAVSPLDRPTSPGDPSHPLHALVVSEREAERRLAARAVQIAFFRARVRVQLVTPAELATLDVAPDLAIVDDTAALAALDLLRALPRGHAMSALVLRRETGEWFRYAALGVEDFFDEPIDLSRLVARIQRLMAGAGWPVEVCEDEVEG
ncbi:MAG: serine/threonine protein kinase [Polyangiaceae bacterium]|nr:serine/threonine protein kinase [Polyangiaceae bacterium]